MRGVLLAALGTFVLADTPALAGANDVLECDFREFRNALRSPGPALVAEVPGTMSPIPLNAVQVTDKSITRKVLVEGLFARRTPTGTLEVMARLVNCTDYPLQVEGRSWFMDENQLPSEGESAWRRVFLNPRSTAVYREFSIGTADVANYLIEIREGR